MGAEHIKAVGAAATLPCARCLQAMLLTGYSTSNPASAGGPYWWAGFARAREEDEGKGANMQAAGAAAKGDTAEAPRLAGWLPLAG